MSAALCVLLPLAVAYAVSLRWVWDVWWLDDSYYGHGPLVVALGLGLAWSRRARFRELPGGGDGRGFLLLGPALVVHLAAAALTIDSLSAASLCLALPGAVWVAWGAARLRAAASLLGLTLFAVPLPLFVTGELAFHLKELAVELGRALAELLGAGVERRAAHLWIEGQSRPLVVADACSGLRSLIALTTLGYCIAFFLGTGWRRRAVLLAAALPVAVACNVGRIAGLCGVAQVWGIDAAEGFAHDAAGVGMWLVALALLLGLDALLARAGGRR